MDTPSATATSGSGLMPAPHPFFGVMGRDDARMCALGEIGSTRAFRTSGPDRGGCETFASRQALATAAVPNATYLVSNLEQRGEVPWRGAGRRDPRQKLRDALEDFRGLGSVRRVSQTEVIRQRPQIS